MEIKICFDPQNKSDIQQAQKALAAFSGPTGEPPADGAESVVGTLPKAEKGAPTETPVEAPAESSASIEQLKEAATAVLKAGDRDLLADVVQKFGVPKITAIEEGDWPEAIAMLQGGA